MAKYIWRGFHMFQIVSSLLKLKHLLFILKQFDSCDLVVWCWCVFYSGFVGVQRPFGIKSNLVICYYWLWLLLRKCFRKLVHRDNIPPTPPDSWLCLFLPRLMISSFWQTCPFFVFRILMEYGILLQKKTTNNLGTCWCLWVQPKLWGEHLKIMNNLVICC